MTAVSKQEIAPGLVVFLSPATLQGVTSTETNAAPNREVSGGHYFLILKVEGETVTAAPLFSQTSSGAHALDESLKGGLASKWIGSTSYYSQYQLWRMTRDAVVQASSADEASPTNRRTYAASDLAVLSEIEQNAMAKNSYGWRSA